MAYGSCPMFGGSGFGGFYLNWIVVAIIISLIFWGVYYLLIKNKVFSGDRRK